MYMDLSKKRFDISSCGMHVIAMVSMLIDHSLKTAFESSGWILVLGRLAFPVFAFMAAEGYARTHDYKKYVLRMLICAIISEIPYNLMKSGTAFDMYDQNVCWTFLLALLCMKLIDIGREKHKKWLSIIFSVGGCIIGFVFGMLFSVDYGGMGVMTVLVFYFFRERTWWNRLAQLVLLGFINIVFLGAFGYGVTLELANTYIELPLQAFALFALIPIWLYSGRQGYHGKCFQYACYSFYPIHMLILWAVSRLL